MLRFGPDGKLYLFMGDQGRRGWMQNLPNGPFLTAPFVDDTFGGPAPDNAHLSGVILRLNDDGTAPADNPFFAVGAAMGGEVGANIQKVYSYGHRNGFGMAFDPYSGFLWDTENADDAYQRAQPGDPGNERRLGPVGRPAQPDLRLEIHRDDPVRQQSAAGSLSADARGLHRGPGPVANVHAARRNLCGSGSQLEIRDRSGRNDIRERDALGSGIRRHAVDGIGPRVPQVGGNGGSVYRFELTADRLHVDVSADPRLADRVADNLFRAQKFDGTESETLQIGTGFGTTPSIEQGPDGNLYVVSVTDNAIYKISRKPQ